MNDASKLFLSVLDQYVEARIRLAENERLGPEAAERLLNYEVEHIDDTKGRLVAALDLLIDGRNIDMWRDMMRKMSRFG